MQPSDPTTDVPGNRPPVDLRPGVPGFALRRAWSRGYGRAELRADLLAGMAVGVVALPLSMALAIAVGVPPQHGLYTAIIAGALIALLGGSRVQVSGPTAAFVVILAPIVTRYGLAGLMLATAMAGVILLALGLGRFGRLIEFVPDSVTAGFTAGIGIVIATLQLRDFFGLEVPVMPEHYPERVVALVRALPSLQWQELATGALALALLLGVPRLSTRVPSQLVALLVVTPLAWLATRWVPGFEVDTLQSRFTYELGGRVLAGIPQLPPLPLLPWHLPGPGGQPLELSLGLLRELFPSALAIAVLGAIESLLSAVVADGMIGGKHDPDAELMAQGVGNLVVPFFGGFAATGAIARTATNVRAGARSPFAAVFHSIFVLLAVLLTAPLLGYVPMAALAAILLVTAWNMSEARHLPERVLRAPKSDASVLVACLVLTVLFDMVVAVVVGIVLAALLFMRRMAEVSGVELVPQGERRERLQLPDHVLLFELAGPLFFGAVSKAIAALERVPNDVRIVLLDLRSVPALDGTAIHQLEAAVSRLHQRGVVLILGGLQAQPVRALARAGWHDEPGRVHLRPSFEGAVELARDLPP